MDKTYTVKEIEEILSMSYDEYVRDMMKDADEKNESESRKEELKFSLLLHITPYRLMIMKNLLSVEE